MTIKSSAHTPSLICRLEDGTGGLNLVFVGRRKVAGIEPGTKLVAEATVNQYAGRLALLNPDYQLIATPDQDGGSPGG